MGLIINTLPQNSNWSIFFILVSGIGLYIGFAFLLGIFRRPQFELLKLAFSSKS
jgi:hypothetical protein